MTKKKNQGGKSGTSTFRVISIKGIQSSYALLGT